MKAFVEEHDMCERVSCDVKSCLWIVLILIDIDIANYPRRADIDHVFVFNAISPYLNPELIWQAHKRR